MGENFPIASSLSYGEVTGKLLILAKENGLVSAQKFFANALVTSINHFKIEYPITIVPIPSQRKSVRRRGFDSMKEIAKFILQDPDLKTDIELEEALKITRPVSDQSSLSEEERYRNLDKALRVNNARTSKAILVIDDVITTGSTLREAIRALKERNLTVIGAATACATQRRLAIG
ncbi:MAG: ComF family protein [Actinomycetota bacterium]